MTAIRVAIAGVGNCASSLVQGVHYYADADPGTKVPGLMHVQFGDYHVRAGEKEKGLIYLERAAALEPFEATANVRRARVLVSQSRYADALPLLKRAQELEPQDDVARYIEQVERAVRARR